MSLSADAECRVLPNPRERSVTGVSQCAKTACHRTARCVPRTRRRVAAVAACVTTGSANRRHSPGFGSPDSRTPQVKHRLAARPGRRSSPGVSTASRRRAVRRNQVSRSSYSLPSASSAVVPRVPGDLVGAGRARAPGSASSTRAAPGPAGRAAAPARAGRGASSPMSPTSSATSAASVTSTASPRSSSCTPADSPLVTGPGHAHREPAEPLRRAGGDQRAAAVRGLDHHGAPGERGDDPVAEDEPARRGMVARRQLPDHQALFGDPADQLGVSARVGPVDPAGEHGDGGAARGQRAPVRGAVDAVGAARRPPPSRARRARRRGSAAMWAP